MYQVEEKKKNRVFTSKPKLPLKSRGKKGATGRGKKRKKEQGKLHAKKKCLLNTVRRGKKWTCKAFGGKGNRSRLYCRWYEKVDQLQLLKKGTTGN